MAKTETQKTEMDLWKDWRKTGNSESMDSLMKSMDPFLQSYVNRFSTSPLPRPALESQARILAVKALGTYNPKFGTQLNTHIGNELKHLHRYVLEYQNVGKIPENRGMAISKFKNIKTNLEEDLGREPTTIELADELGWTPTEVERMHNELRQDLNVTQGKDESFFDANFNTTDTAKDMVDYVYWSSPPLEQKIMEYWFGIGGNPRLSVAQIAKKLHKSENEIRKLSKEIAAKINQNL
jgi:RNA polymerase primary sigma factor